MFVPSSFILLLPFLWNLGQLAYLSIEAISQIKHPLRIGRVAYSNKAMLVLQVLAIGP